jgi:hypothetical protein
MAKTVSINLVALGTTCDVTSRNDNYTDCKNSRRVSRKSPLFADTVELGAPEISRHGVGSWLHVYKGIQVEARQFWANLHGDTNPEHKWDPKNMWPGRTLNSKR